MGNRGRIARCASSTGRGGLPDRVRYLRDQCELLLLNVLCGQVSAGQGRGEAALGGDAEPFEAGVPGRLVDPRRDLAYRLQGGGLARHQPEDDLLVVGRLGERRERPGPLVVVLEQDAELAGGEGVA